jgi:hypothetical protein
MAKGQQRKPRESKKPKAEKKIEKVSAYAAQYKAKPGSGPIKKD